MVSAFENIDCSKWQFSIGALDDFGVGYCLQKIFSIFDLEERFDKFVIKKISAERIYVFTWLFGSDCFVFGGDDSI